MTSPVVTTLRIDLDGLKHHVVHALQSHQDAYAEAVRLALDAALEGLTAEVVLARITQAVDNALFDGLNQVLPEVVHQAVHEYFSEGEGAAIVLQAIKEKFKL